MKYEFRTKSASLSLKELEQVGHLLLYLIKQVRKLGPLPLEGYTDRSDLEGDQEVASYAEMSILDVAKTLGLSFGPAKNPDWGTRPGELNVSDQ